MDQLTFDYLPVVAPVLVVLLTILAAAVHVSARERRDVGPASDHGTRIYLNDETPSRLDSSSRGLSSTREGAEL